MVLADFDFAFFDLQSSPSEYQDNPHHYILSSKPNKGKARGSRYPLVSTYTITLLTCLIVLNTDSFSIGTIS
jgi:hypothetical protein